MTAEGQGFSSVRPQPTLPQLALGSASVLIPCLWPTCVITLRSSAMALQGLPPEQLTGTGLWGEWSSGSSQMQQVGVAVHSPRYDSRGFASVLCH
jgi:hypothetical protein